MRRANLIGSEVEVKNKSLLKLGTPKLQTRLDVSDILESKLLGRFKICNTLRSYIGVAQTLILPPKLILLPRLILLPCVLLITVLPGRFNRRIIYHIEMRRGEAV